MDLDTLMKETAPVADPTPRVIEAGRGALTAALEPVLPANARRHDTIGRVRRSRARRLGLAGAVAATATIGLLFGPTFNLLGTRNGSSAEAAQVLMRAGAAAGAQPGGWPNAKYWYSIATTTEPHTAVNVGGTYRRQIWIGHHDVGVMEDPSVEKGVIPIGVAVFPAGGSALSWDQLYALPTESRALEHELRAGIHGAGPDDNSELYTIVGDLLRESPAPPALRRALWEVAARIPGVTVVGEVTDGAGRRGVAVERGGQRYVLDPETGRLLEESETGGMRTTYLEQGPASHAPTPTNG
jgi:hypothetical protein